MMDLSKEMDWNLEHARTAAPKEWAFVDALVLCCLG